MVSLVGEAAVKFAGSGLGNTGAAAGAGAAARAAAAGGGAAGTCCCATASMTGSAKSDQRGKRWQDGLDRRIKLFLLELRKS